MSCSRGASTLISWEGVLPELVADGVGKDIVCGKEVLVTVVTTGMTVGLTPLIDG